MPVFIFSRLLKFVFILVTSVALSACIYYSGPGGFSGGWNDRETIRGSGNTVSEVRQVSGISTVSLRNQGDLIIAVGDTESLVVEAEDNLLPLILTDVRGGELRIENSDPGYFRTREPIRYYLTVRKLEGIEVRSTGSVSAPDLSADHFDIRISSTGNVDMGSLNAGLVEINISSTGDAMMRNLEADSLDVRISSTGHVSIRSGQVNSQKIRISSTGSFEATDLASNVAEVHLTSTGSAYINVDGYLDASLSSTGSLHFRGDPRRDIRRSSTGRAIMVSRR